nr:phosphate uptake regulator PhoU [Sulfuracidifex tepidarius]
MLKDALVSIESQDLEIAKEILGRDDEVDRFFFYVARQLTLSVSSLNILTEEGYNLTQVVDLYSIVKSIERVADHASRIAENIPYTEKLQHRSDVLEVGKMSMEFYEKSISGFLNQRKEMSHEVIGSNMRTFEKVIRTADLLLAEERDVKATSSGIMILDSFRRVMRYSIDIAEATIDLISKTIEASRTSES